MSLLILNAFSALSQAELAKQFTTTVAPMAPNAAALSKYVDVPVSYYTGTPQVGVPIYEINSKSLSLPISLNYHASGIRVDDVASWVGLGWSLNAGGMISRTVHGLADESVNGFFNKGYLIQTPTAGCDNSGTLPCNYLRNISIENIIDSEPDIYFLNLPNGDGVKFTFDYNGNLYMQNYKQVSITKNAAMTEWIVATQDGTQYYFGQSGIYGATDLVTVTPDGAGATTSTSGWHLYKMVSPDKLDIIYFEYGASTTFQNDNPVQEVYYQRDNAYLLANPICVYCDNLTPSKKVTGSSSTTQRSLSRITYNNGSVEFIPSPTLRADLNDYGLSRINIKNKQGGLLKYFMLSQGTMGSLGNLRLKLSGVQEFSATGSPLPPYQFFYDETNALPPRGSFKQDHWGFANNNLKDSFIPQKIEKPDGTFIYYSQGGNRNADPILTKSFVLTKIQYPLGGFDLFEFEANDIGTVATNTATEYYTEAINYSANANAANSEVIIQQSFTLDKSYSVDVSVGGQCCGTCGCGTTTQSCEKATATATLTGPGVSVGWSCQATTKTSYMILNAGTYSIELLSDYLSSSVRSNSYININIYKSRNVTITEPQYVGGVRIKRLSRFDGINPLPVIKRFEYTTLKDGQLVSSGVLVRKPKYYGTYLGSKDLTEITGAVILCPYDIGSSTSVVSLGDGGHIGYSEVKVIQGENGENGYEVYKYTTAKNFPDVGGQFFPYPSPESRDSRRGLLLEHQVLDRDNRLLSHTINTYKQRTDNYYGFANGLKVGMPFPRKNDYILRNYIISTYSFWQEWQYLESTIERTYQVPYTGSFLETVSTNYYDRPTNHVQMTRQEKTIDNGVILKTLYKYPQDYALGGTSLLNINAMVSSRIFNTPVEVQTWRVQSGTANMISGRITDFDPIYFKPTRIWSFDSGTPITALNSEGMTNGKFLTLLSDNNQYKLRAEMGYGNGQIIFQNKVSDIKSSYLWGYDNAYLLAEVTNAAPSSSTANAEFFYEGFEERTVTGITTPHTGKKYLVGDYTTSFIKPNTRNYIIEYWYLTGSQWNYATTTYTNNMVLTNGDAIDDVRIYPSDARMKSYTYEPTIGITSMIDENGTVLIYNYDSFGRLSNVRNENGGIEKQYAYNYKTN